MKKLLIGNQAVAEGLHDGGVRRRFMRRRLRKIELLKLLVEYGWWAYYSYFIGARKE